MSRNGLCTEHRGLSLSKIGLRERFRGSSSSNIRLSDLRAVRRTPKTSMEPSEALRLCGAVAPLQGDDGVATAFAAELRECAGPLV